MLKDSDKADKLKQSLPPSTVPHVEVFESQRERTYTNDNRSDLHRGQQEDQEDGINNFVLRNVKGKGRARDTHVLVQTGNQKEKFGIQKT